MTQPFSAWRVGLPYYGTLLAIGVVLLVTLLPYGLWWIGGAVIAVGMFTLNFFRDPVRTVPDDPGVVVSPADGTVVAVEDLEETEHYEGPCRRISIFLSVFNVHVNRAPYDGQTTQVIYKEGRYVNAMSAESSKVNESNAIWMNSSEGPMTVRQVSGAVARRIICLPTPGEPLERGQKIGMIKFGSRTELYLPPGTEVTVQLKDKVKGGATVVARFKKD